MHLTSHPRAKSLRTKLLDAGPSSVRLDGPSPTTGRRWGARLVSPSAPDVAQRISLGAAVGAILLILVGVTLGWTTALDERVLARVDATRTHTLDQVWLGVTGVGSFPTVVIIALALGIGSDLALKKHGAITARISVALILDLVFVSAIKSIVGRARPTGVVQLTQETDASFPSGHVSVTAALLTVLVIVGFTMVRRTAVRAAMVSAAAFGVAMMAWSRLYLGVHWPTDVIAGVFAGIAIGCAADLVVNWFERRTTNERWEEQFGRAPE